MLQVMTKKVYRKSKMDTLKNIPKSMVINC